MPASPDADRRYSLIVDEIRAALGEVVAIYAFGSAAHGVEHAASDLDIGVLARRRLDAVERFEIQERLAAVAGRDVDLVDLASVTPVMAVQVVAHGRLICSVDDDARGRFEDRVLGAYARLNEERRGILERIAEEGTIYGR